MKSRALGNSGIEASHYLVECRIHLYDVDQNEKHLSDAEQVLIDTNYRASGNQLLWFDVGEIHIRRGFAAMATGQHAIAVGSFGTALLAYQQAGRCEADPRLASDFLRVKRGYTALKAYTSRHELGLPDDPALLDASIHDLRSGGDSLPAALLLRSIRLRRERRYIEAAEDLNEALQATSKESSFAAENGWRCIAGLAECAIQIGIEKNDVNAVFAGCEQILTVPISMREVNIGSAIYGARFLLDNHLVQYSEIARRIAYNIRNRLTTITDLPLEAYRFAASHGSSLLLRVQGVLADEHSLRAAYELSSSAVMKGGNPAPELLTLAGEAALQLGKRLLRKGDEHGASDLLQDAGEHFENAVTAATRGSSNAFSLQTAHSKAGEAYARAHALSGQEKYAEKATLNLKRSQQLGNLAPELVGLLGDVAYRQGRRNGDESKLRLALELKAEARLRGNISRENRSVSTAAAFALWRVCGIGSDLAAAVQSAIEAVEIDPMWPWPFFQLAEMGSLSPDLRRASTDQLLMLPLRPDLVRMVRNGDVERLLEIGCRLAIQNEEFEKSEFGSRQPVYVLDDPHDLLKQTVVFKETIGEDGVREKETTEEFAKYLSSVGAPSSFKLPEPLLLVPNANKIVYVMKRARGIQLGKATLLASSKAEIIADYERAIHFLAYYHAWRLAGRSLSYFNRQMNARVVRKAFRCWRLAKFECTDMANLISKILLMFPPNLPCIPKKDAHPENWLIDDDKNLVMLDLESTANWPIFYELVQLVDDYPLLPANDEGWNQRLAYCNLYLEHLSAAGINLLSYRATSADAYAIFVLLRIAYGCARNRTGKLKRTSSAVHSSSARDIHYFALLDYLARANLKEISHLAAEIRQAITRDSICTSAKGQP